METREIQLKIRLSPFGLRALKKIDFEKTNFILDLFVHKIKNERYREFCDQPKFHTNIYGKRVVKILPIEPNACKIIVGVTLATHKTIRYLQSLGHSLSWIVEEALFFGFQNSLLD